MQPRKRVRVEDGQEEPTKVLKNRACTECKKHKIKCDRAQGESDCIRCTRLGHRCVIETQLQRIIEKDTNWKSTATAQMTQLQAAVSDLLHAAALPHLATYGNSSDCPPVTTILINQSSPQSAAPHGSTPTEHPTAMTRHNSQEPEAERELVSAPMGSLYEVTKLRNLRSHFGSHRTSNVNMLEEDFISRGALSIGKAETLFALFFKTMNQFLWGGIALLHDDLTSVRRSSSILSAAILTVAALHVPGDIELFNTCYIEFITLVSSSTLNRYHTLDEIRALAIGAFWLSDLSWKLSGHAVRIATEMNLHQSLQKMLRGEVGDRENFERARLWYLLYVCDHHFSIAYGRPPVIHDSPSITNYRAFLESPLAGQGDIRLCIQVAVFSILTKVYHTFGSDIEQPLAEEDLIMIREYNFDIESWRIKSQPMSADNVYVGSYPSKGVVLYYHFAKFQVNSLALRAIYSNHNMSLERREAANLAISSAMAILNAILYEPDIRNSIVGIPLFTHTMVAFSSVFLMKVAWKWKSASLYIDQPQIQHLVNKVVELLSTAEASENHLTYYIASGLSKMLEEFTKTEVVFDGANGNDLQGRYEGQTGANAGMALHDTGFNIFDSYGVDFDNTWGALSNSAEFLALGQQQTM